MKFLVVGDVHISTISSIVTSRGEKYSTRLENCIKSINWAENEAIKNTVDKVIYIGDLFDKGTLNAEEITALQEIRWSDIPHIILVGNHELGNHEGTLSTAHLMNLLPDFEVVEKAITEETANANIVYLPYVFEEDRSSLTDYYIGLHNADKPVIVISHNDMAGISYGAYVSEAGFNVEEIKKNCDLYINGHIHNGQVLNEKPMIINIGNLTGQNFGEDASKYEHHIVIFDDETLGIEYIENPYAFNFYKLEINSESQINKLNLKPNTVLSIKCKESLVSILKERLATMNIAASKIVPVVEISHEQAESIEELHTNDYLEQFTQYILQKEIGPEDLVRKMLQEIAE